MLIHLLALCQWIGELLVGLDLEYPWTGGLQVALVHGLQN